MTHVQNRVTHSLLNQSLAGGMALPSLVQIVRDAASSEVYSHLQIKKKKKWDSVEKEESGGDYQVRNL